MLLGINEILDVQEKSTAILGGAGRVYHGKN